MSEGLSDVSERDAMVHVICRLYLIVFGVTETYTSSVIFTMHVSKRHNIVMLKYGE